MGALTPERIADFYAAGQLVMLAAGRPLGFALLFTAFAWGHLNSGLLRIAFALVLALPVMAPLWLTPQMVITGLPAPFVILVAKELFLGIVIGFMMSLPFEALGIAGGIIDNYRGSGAPLSSPAGEVTPFAQVFMVAALWLFAALGGFWIVTDMIFASYGFWPLLETVPALSMDGVQAFFLFLTKLLRMAIIIAGPLLALMVAIDLSFAIAGKLGKQLNVTYLAVSVKALVATLALPLFMLAVVRVISGEVQALSALDALLKAAVR